MRNAAGSAQVDRHNARLNVRADRRAVGEGAEGPKAGATAAAVPITASEPTTLRATWLSRQMQRDQRDLEFLLSNFLMASTMEARPQALRVESARDAQGTGSAPEVQPLKGRYSGSGGGFD